MKKGERMIISIHHDYAFGDVEVRRDIAIVPPGSNVVYYIEMMDFIKEKAPWVLNSKEKIEVAGRMKEEGNVLFKVGNYQRAGEKYEKAADFVDEDGSFGFDEQKQAQTLKVSCWLNGAACSLKSNDFPGAIKLCSQKLDISGCENISHVGLSKLTSISGGLGKLILADGSPVTLSLADGLNKLSMLQSIVLDGYPVTSEGLRAIGNLFISLRELSLSKCLGVTDEALSFLVSKHTDLRKLDITCCRKITDVSIASISNLCTGLTSLNMESCTLVLSEAFVLSGEKCHYLEELDLTYNEIDDESLPLSLFFEDIKYHISCYTYLVFLEVLCPFLLVLGFPT